MKIGILGGTFDPIHKGHLLLATKIKYEFELDKVIFIPTGNPAHKIFSRVVPGAMRIEMIKMAIALEQGLEVYDGEVKRRGYTYTVDTLDELKKLYPSDELYYLVGTDVLETVEKWKDFDKIKTLASFIGVRRPGNSDEEYREALKHVRSLGANVLEAKETSGIEVSSSEIRELIKNRDNKIYELLPRTVVNYIIENDLYDDEKQVGREQILKDLKEILTEEKYFHSLGVSKEAKRLALEYGADPDKAELAGLLHDCAKNVSPDQLKLWFDMNIEDFGDGRPYNGINRRVIHGPVGRLVAMKRFGVTDDEVLDAIAQHVTGKPEMSLLSAIVFISDYTEENREGEVFDKIRTALNNEGLYQAIVTACDLTTELIIKRKEQMDAQMVYTRNWAITKIGGKI